MLNLQKFLNFRNFYNFTKIQLFFFSNKAIKLDIDIPYLGGVRSETYTLVIEDNIIQKVYEEPDGNDSSRLLILL
jgi:hypothetical protein